jgi:capsular polysaccharide biosynthesis protein
MLWLFLASPLFQSMPPKSYRFVLPEATPDWAFEMLNLGFGITKEEIIITENRKATRCKNLIVPSMLRVENIMSPSMNAYPTELVNSLAQSSKRPFPHRFFVTRRGVKSFMTRQIVNEDQLETIAQEHGYALVDPAELSWPDQIKLFSTADVVVGPFGSGMHNTIFAPPTTISLVLGASHMNWFQSGISALRSQRMSYLFPQSEQMINGELFISYDTEKFSQCLKELNKISMSLK